MKNWMKIFEMARGMKIMAAGSTVYQMREQLSQLSTAIRADADRIAQMAADPDVDVEKLGAIEKGMKDKQTRFDMLKRVCDAQEAREREAVKTQQEQTDPATGKGGEKAKAKAAFYSAVVRHGDVRSVIDSNVNALGAIPAGTDGGGENLLPTTLQTELVHEAFEQHPVLSEITTSAVTGLEVPTSSYTLDDDADVNDGAAAKDLAIDTSTTISYGRHKTKIKAKVSDTVLRGTPVAIESYVDGALHDGMAAKTIKRLFATAPKSGEEHMSVYATTGVGAPNIKRVSGANVIEGVLKALGDLSDEASTRAKVIMRRADYYDAIMTLANGSATLWGAKPADIIGAPVIFCESAVKPVVGDLKRIRVNYDMPSAYDSDKDVSTGMHLFVLTNWDDMHVELPGSLRVVEVSAEG